MSDIVFFLQSDGGRKATLATHLSLFRLDLQGWFYQTFSWCGAYAGE